MFSASKCGIVWQWVSALCFILLQERHQELHNREEPIKSMLTKGQEIVDACPPEDVVQITDRLKKLKDLWTDTKERAQKRKVGDF